MRYILVIEEHNYTNESCRELFERRTTKCQQQHAYFDGSNTNTSGLKQFLITCMGSYKDSYASVVFDPATIGGPRNFSSSDISSSASVAGSNLDCRFRLELDFSCRRDDDDDGLRSLSVVTSVSRLRSLCFFFFLWWLLRMCSASSCHEINCIRINPTTSMTSRVPHPVLVFLLLLLDVDGLWVGALFNVSSSRDRTEAETHCTAQCWLIPWNQTTATILHVRVFLQL